MKPINNQNHHLIAYIQYLQKKSKSPTTIKFYYYDILQFITFIKIKDVPAITENESKAYLTFMIESVKMSNPSINRKMIALRLFYEYLRRNGQLTHNPFDFFNKMEVSVKSVSVLAPETIHRILDYLKSSIEKASHSDSKTALMMALRNDLIFRLIVFAGLRKTEITNIRLADIIGSPGHSFILKIMNRGVRTVPLPDKVIPSLTAYLKQRKSDSVSLFLDDIGKKPVSHFVVHRLFSNISMVMNERITPGRVRRFFASQLSTVSSDIMSLHNLLGHSKLETTFNKIMSPLIKHVPSKGEGGDSGGCLPPLDKACPEQGRGRGVGGFFTSSA